MNKKKKNNPFLAITLVLITTFCTSFGQMFWKLSVDSGLTFSAIFSWQMILGWVLHIIGASLLIVALKLADLSVVYPSFALAFVWTIFLSRSINESVQLNHIIGIGVLVVGIILLGIGGSE